MTDTKPAEKPAPQLPPGHLQLFEQVSIRYDAVIAQGVKPDAMLEPGFWAHHAVKLRPMNEIRARAEDGTWIAYLVVLDCSRNWAKVQILHLHQLTSADVSLTQASEQEVRTFIEKHSVTWRAQHKFSIVRKADRAVIHEGIETKDGAQAWLEGHARAQVGGQPLPKPEAVTT